MCFNVILLIDIDLCYTNVRDFTGDGGDATNNEDGVMIDGSIKASKSKHDQPKNRAFQWLMAGFLPLASERTRPLPGSTFSTISIRQLPSGVLSTFLSDAAFLPSVFIIH
jgi:hypothetical protein